MNPSVVISHVFSGIQFNRLIVILQRLFVMSDFLISIAAIYIGQYKIGTKLYCTVVIGDGQIVVTAFFIFIPPVVICAVIQRIAFYYLAVIGYRITLCQIVQNISPRADGLLLKNYILCRLKSQASASILCTRLSRTLLHIDNTLFLLAFALII